MGLLDEQLALDSEFTASTDEFAESVTYTKIADASTVACKAVIRRRLAETVSNMRPGFAPEFDVWIRNHATLGVTSVDTGGDTITFARRYGGATTVMRILEVVEQDAGMWRLLCR